MSETQAQGGAGSAIAAHSKDASAPGQTPASSATGDVQGQVGSVGDRLTESASNAAEQTGQDVSGQGNRLASRGLAFVRERPLLALALTAAACFSLGFVGRRR